MEGPSGQWNSQLDDLRRQYHSLYPVYLLQLPLPAHLALPAAQGYLVEQILFHPELERYAPEPGYRRSFWRKVVKGLEEGVVQIHAQDSASEIEVDERLYEAVTELMVDHAASTNDSPLTSSTPGSSFRTFIYDTPTWLERHPPYRDVAVGTEGRATLLEESAAIQAGTTGLRTWTASLHLAHHILNNPYILSQNRQTQTRQHTESSPPEEQLPHIIELGAGTGFLSILLAQLGATVTATDLGDEVGDPQDGKSLRRTPLERLKGNIQLNKLDLPPRAMALNWMDALEDAAKRPSVWEDLRGIPGKTVVAADVIYDPDLVPALVATVHLLISDSSNPGIALIAATVRNQSTLELFGNTCAQYGLVVEILPLKPMSVSRPTFWNSSLEGPAEVRIMRIRPRGIS